MEHIVVLCEDNGGSICRCIRRLFGGILPEHPVLTVLHHPTAARFPNPQQVIAVVAGEDRAGLAALRRQKLRAVTCGFSARDTLTLSSLTGEQAVICLQRTLEAADGRAVEPMEFAVARCEGTPPYHLLAAAAVLLLCTGEGTPVTNRYRKTAAVRIKAASDKNII